MSKHENAMKNQVFSLPPLIRQQYEDLEPKTRKALNHSRNIFYAEDYYYRLWGFFCGWISNKTYF